MSNDITVKETAGIVPPQPITENLYADFIEYVDASEKTIQTYTRAIRQFAKWMDSNGITRPVRKDIISYRDFLKLEHKPTTVQNYITAVRLFFQWTAQEGIYPNVAERVKGAKIDKAHKKDCLTSRQVQKILELAKGETLEELRNYAILSLMFTGGLRTIEVSRANIDDLRAVGDSPVLYVQGKGKDEKTEFIKLMPEVEDAIREYLSTRETVAHNAPLFISLSNNSRGQRLSTRTISGIVKAAFKKAGYDSERLTAHSTRHTAVTLALLGGESLRQVQDFARHINVTTTQVYAHDLDRAKNTCASTIANLIF